MKSKWLINFAVIILLCIATFLGLAQHDFAFAAKSATEKIEGTLLEQIAMDGPSDFIIHFADQPDLTPAYAMDWEARGEFVYNTLRETAERSQLNAKRILDSQGFSYQTFITGNELYVFANNQSQQNRLASASELTTLDQLSALSEVSSIRATRIYAIDPVSIRDPFQDIRWAGDLLSEHLLTTVKSSTIATVDWGITDTNANQFWTTFGKQGQGIVVASIDTGVQWNHPALLKSFKCGTNSADPKCWKDPANICGLSGACDNNGHGTHTMGTMIGDDDGSLPYIVGMAPGARWIACKGCETNDCSDFALNSCADWIIAPGDNPNNRPDIVNNSWGGPGGDAWFQLKVDAWRAAGIFPAFSAGNNYNCASLGSPGDYQSSFSSASYRNGGTIADYSSKGPSFFGDTPYTKPNIAAPGSNIMSTYPTTIYPGTWAMMSGTSMASPHTSGAVALLWSCNPALVGNLEATFRLLQDTARPSTPDACGSPADGQGNFTYGYGFLDVQAAGAVTCNIVSPTNLYVNLTTNQTETIGLVLTNKSPSSLIWSIEESPSNVSWLNETPLSGMIPVDGHTDISVTFNAAGLSVGKYQTKLIIQSDDPYTPIQSVPVIMRVGLLAFIPSVFNH